jgi:hypothetical protein
MLKVENVENVLMGKKNVAENASKISALAPTISNS